MSERCTIDLAIPGSTDDWALRMESVCVATENLMSPLDAIKWSRSQKDGKADEAVEDRPAMFRKLAGRSAQWFSLHNGRDCFVDRSDTLVDEGQVSVGGRFNDLGKRVYSLTVSCPSAAESRIEALCERIADASGAFSARYSPHWTRIHLHRGQFMNDWDAALAQGADPLVTQLPRLGSMAYGAALRDPAQPEMLGWLNYWSAAACAWIGFPDEARDQQLLQFSHRSANGAWMVKLTRDALDLRRIEHVKALLHAYERFQQLGIRAAQE